MSKWQFLGIGGAGHSRLAALAAGLAVAVAGLTVSVPASAQVATTKHNLGSNGTGANRFTGTAEICVFCHTPHGADTTASVPLWNRTLPAPGSFTTYDSLGTSTLDGKTAPVGSVSIACLSCHDGVTSMSAVINAPGSGTTGDAAWQAGTWIGAVGGKMPAGIANLGQDLRNDHPIGIQYGGGGIVATGAKGASTGTTKDTDFVAPTDELLGSTRIWYVDTGTAGRQKTDLTLYTRPSSDVGGSAGNFEPFVECASCHDPHTAANPTFLRISNANSAVCLACHIK